MPFSGVSRVSTQMMSNMLMRNMQGTQVDYALVQQQLATGDKLLNPSDDPAAANKVMSLDRVMSLNSQIQANLESTMSIFNQCDVALGNATNLVVDTKSLASSSLNLSTQGEYEANARNIKAYIDSMIDAGNTRVGNIYVFGGTASTDVPFEKVEDGIIYRGSFEARQANLGGVGYTELGLLGPEAFGMNSVTIECSNDLSPAMTNDTRLADLNGAIGRGIRLGTIEVSDGTVSESIDLTGCDRVGDVIDKINDATGGAITCSIRADGLGLELTSTSPGANITVDEYASGYVARDLGLFNVAGAGATLTGNDVRPSLTASTEIASMNAGAGIDVASGLTVTNGSREETFIFNTETTVGDIINRLNNSEMGIYARINDVGDGIEINNLISGSDLHIAENGGTTASDLGIRSLDATTKLSDFRDGRGVRLDEGKDDLRIMLTADAASGGGVTELNVNLDGCTNMGDVIAAINSAAAADGLAVTASEKTVGNGIEIVDSSGTTVNIEVISLNDSQAAEDLGLYGSYSGDTATGSDTYDRRAGGVLDTMLRLQRAVYAGNDAEITFLTDKLDSEDNVELISERGRLGALVQDLEDRSLHNEDMDIDNQAMRSLLADTDYYEAITRYSQLAMALQASMQTSSSMLNTSLLSYLS